MAATKAMTQQEASEHARARWPGMGGFADVGFRKGQSGYEYGYHESVSGGGGAARRSWFSVKSYEAAIENADRAERRAAETGERAKPSRKPKPGELPQEALPL